MMNSYKKLNNIIGWAVFAIAATVYLLTIEPTASLWDCGEFLSSAFKLEVGHPPGAPLFIMLGRCFMLFSPSPDKAAMFVNAMSGILSALTILFLFWTITHLMVKLLNKKREELDLGEMILVFGAGLVGALAYTFSDTFWFSAVEAEVYAASSFFTAVVFWAILKWEDEADEKYANRWLLLIAYLMGLSIGVHQLNLLTIPAMVFVYYFRKYNVTTAGVVKAAITSVVILGTLLFVVMPGILIVASWFEIAFVNGVSLPVNSGTLFFVALFFVAMAGLMYYSYKKRKLLLNSIVTIFTFFVLGYGCYAMIIIRSSANPPMDQNNPDNIFALISYLNRDQYGRDPLFTGPYFNAPTPNLKKVTKKYVLDGDKYVKASDDYELEYDPRFTTAFPRMYNPNQAETYKLYVKKGKTVTVTGEDGKPEMRKIPTFGENINFLFDYQLGWMYWRYFMWNFSGRQNDLQGFGDQVKGNWLTGIKFLDEARLGPQDDLPEYLGTNKGNNKYYMLPLLVGLMGLLVQLFRDKKNFTVVMLLFFLTGIAIVLYLNTAPNQPRERDYAYSGSFYAFAIWIGMGVTVIHDLLRRVSPGVIAAGAATVICLLAVPTLMAKENWDDHDRSGRYVTTDFGHNYLISCAPNSMVFTYGDNDTFALWYNQEVEGVGQDKRVANLSYLQSGWYYEQMMKKAYDSDAFKTAATPSKILGDRRNRIFLNELTTRPLSLPAEMEFVMSDEKQNQLQSTRGEGVNYFRSKTLRLPLNADEMIKAGILDPAKRDSILPYVDATLTGDITKEGVAILDFIGNNLNNRPIYFGITAPPSNYYGMQKYFAMEGLAYRIDPEFTASTPGPRVNTEIMYDNVINKFNYRNLNNPNVYMDEATSKRTILYLYRETFMLLIQALIDEGQNEKALIAVDKSLSVLSDLMNPYYRYTTPFVQYYFDLGQNEKAIELANKVLPELGKELKYYNALYRKFGTRYDMEMYQALEGVKHIYEYAQKYQVQELLEQTESVYKEYSSYFTGA